jgi:hypothetical protein
MGIRLTMEYFADTWSTDESTTRTAKHTIKAGEVTYLHKVVAHYAWDSMNYCVLSIGDKVDSYWVRDGESREWKWTGDADV